MSSTRRRPVSDEDAPLSQERFASSASYEPGLLGNLVARRCKAIRKPEDRSLIYFLQQKSHQEGGLRQLAEELVAMFPERLGTPAMRRIGKVPGQTYTLEEVKELEHGLPRLLRVWDFALWDAPDYYPEEDQTAWTVEMVLEECRFGASKLPEILKNICLDPEIDLAEQISGTLWFDDLIGALHQYRLRSIETAQKAIATTEISRRIFDDLDYAVHAKGLVIIEGEQRTGKSTAAEAWCAMHPGEAIFVKLESGIDEATFFRAIARSLGTACSIQRKAHEMRMRIEDVLQEGHLALVIDEAHFLWGQTVRPRSAPARIDWLRTALLDHGVAVVLISTPQFERQCTRYEKHLSWNAKQIKGRVKLHVSLPDELPEEDLAAVARQMAPEADKASLLRLVGFAQASDDYLAGIERLVCRAAFFAKKEGRQCASSADIKRALDEAMPREQPVAAPAPAKGRKAACNARATALQGRGKALSGNFKAERRDRQQDLSGCREEGSGAEVNRLQFIEADTAAD